SGVGHNRVYTGRCSTIAARRVSFGGSSRFALVHPMKGRTVHFVARVLYLGVLGMVGRAYGGPMDDWSAVTSGTTNHLQAIAFGGGRFVAAGDNGTVLTSLDGISWTLGSSGVTNSIYGIAYGSGKFVAVGSAGLIKTSADGVVWVTQSSIITITSQLN